MAFARQLCAPPRTVVQQAVAHLTPRRRGQQLQVQGVLVARRRRMTSGSTTDRLTVKSVFLPVLLAFSVVTVLNYGGSNLGEAIVLQYSVINGTMS
jgi:hypothetical protein